jgi:hypothetical protein
MPAFVGSRAVQHGRARADQPGGYDGRRMLLAIRIHVPRFRQRWLNAGGQQTKEQGEPQQG